jgi:hypothetical protein
MRKPYPLILPCLVAVSVSVRPQEVQACSCVPGEIRREIVIGPPGTPVPTDTTIRVFLSGFPPNLRKALGREYRIIDETGGVVPLRVRVTQTRLDLQPTRPLRPSTTYTVQRIYAYDSEGVQMTDRERLRASSSSGMQRAWFSIARFETASGPSVAGPRSLGLDFAEMYTLQGGGDCGPAIGLQVGLDPKANLEFTDVIELEVKGHGMVATEPWLRGQRYMGANDVSCNSDPVTLPDMPTMRVRLVVVDVAGRRNPGPWVEVMRKGPGLKGNYRRSPESAMLDSWFGPPVVAATGKQDWPPACPHGFETTAVHQAASTGGPTSYEDPSHIGWAGNEVVVGLHGISLVWVAEAGSIRRRGDVQLSGYLTGSYVDHHGVAIVTRTFDDQEGVVHRLHAIGPKGVLQWSRSLGPGSTPFSSIAANRNRMLVTYIEGGYLTWSLVSRGKGHRLKTARTWKRVRRERGPAVSALLADHFILAYPMQDLHAVELLAVSKTGRLLWDKTLPFETFVTGSNPDGYLDIASAGRSAGLVMVRHGNIELRVINPAGDIEAGPIDVSAGGSATEIPTHGSLGTVGCLPLPGTLRRAWLSSRPISRGGSLLR